MTASRTEGNLDAKELRWWFVDVLESAIWEESKAERADRQPRLDKLDDGTLIYVGDGGEFEVTLTVTPL